MLAPVPDRPARVVLYVRVSALMGRGGDDFHSPDIQTSAMRRATLGMREVGVIDDIDVSGRTFSRGGLDEIRRLAEARQIDAIAVYNLSRLGRNTGEALRFIQWLRDRGVSVISTQEKIDDSPEGQFILSQFLSLAQLYSDQVGRNWSSVAASRAAKGRHHGVVPTGYLQIDGKLIVDPVVGPVVREAFRSYAAGGEVQAIMRRLAAARGRSIRRGAVKNMLRNPVYVGIVRTRTKVAGLIEQPGDHEPLVDEKTWANVKARLERDRRIPPRHVDPAYGLSGLMWCAHCSGPTQIWYSHRGSLPDEKTRRVICARSRQESDGEKKVCGGIGTPLYAQVERVTLDQVRIYARELEGDPAARAEKIARANRAGVDTETLERELAKTGAAMVKLAEAWGRGEVPDAAYHGAMSRLRDSDEQLRTALAGAREIASAPPAAGVVKLVDELVAEWPDMTESQRNRALRAVVAKVKIRRGIGWRQPVDERVDVHFY